MKLVDTSVLAAAVFSATIAAPIRADEASDKTALRRTYKTLEGLFQRGDVARAGTYMTGDYKQRQINGQVLSKQQSLQAYKAMMKMMQVKVAPIKILSMQIKGSRATVVSFGGVTMRVRNPQGQVDTIYSTARTRDHWVKVGGAWRERFVEQLTEETRVNGQVISKNGKFVTPR